MNKLDNVLGNLFPENAAQAVTQRAESTRLDPLTERAVQTVEARLHSNKGIVPPTMQVNSPLQMRPRQRSNSRRSATYDRNNGLHHLGTRRCVCG